LSERILSELKDWGLTALQAKVYLALLQLGTSQVGQLCAASEVARPEVYRILHELIEKGLVDQNLASPAIYTPVEPERAASLLIGRVRQTLNVLEAKRQNLVKDLIALTHQPDQSFHQFSLVRGGENVARLEAHFLNEANEEFVAIMSRHGLTFLNQQITRAIISAKKRKLRIRILTEIIPSNVKKANYFAKLVDVRQRPRLLLYMKIYDKRRVLFGPASLPSDYQAHTDRKELGIWTFNPRFVEGMYAIFESLWQASKKFPA